MTSCVDSYSDIFSHIDYGEGLVEEFSSAGIVPYISESKIKRMVLVLAVVFLVTGGFFVAFSISPTTAIVIQPATLPVAEFSLSLC